MDKKYDEVRKIILKNIKSNEFGQLVVNPSIVNQLESYFENKDTIGVYNVGEEVVIKSAMATDWIGKVAKVTKVLSVNPICYELNIGGGHWLHSMLEKSQ